MMISQPTGRQWLRSHRIALAQAEKRLARTDSARAFWNQVIKANEDK